jgi:hypothetical protein
MVIRAAVALSGNEVQVIAAERSGLVHCIVLSRDKKPANHVRDFPGFVTAAACSPDGTALIAIKGQSADDQGNDILAHATALRAIFRWVPKEQKIDTIFASEKGQASVFWIALSPFRRPGLRDAARTIFSDIDAIAYAAGSIYLASGECILRIDSGRTTPVEFGPGLKATIKKKVQDDPEFAGELQKRIDEIGPMITVLQDIKNVKEAVGVDVDAMRSGKVGVTQTADNVDKVTGLRASNMGK